MNTYNYTEEIKNLNECGNIRRELYKQGIDAPIKLFVTKQSFINITGCEPKEDIPYVVLDKYNDRHSTS